MVALTPGGRMLDEALVDELAARAGADRALGRYEGFDERILEHFATDESRSAATCSPAASCRRWSLCDAVLRKLPGALGHEDSAVEESFSAALEGAPEYPHYTRPAEYRGWRVPEVLLSGHHARIREWRLAQSRERRRR